MDTVNSQNEIEEIKRENVRLKELIKARCLNPCSGALTKQMSELRKYNARLKTVIRDLMNIPIPSRWEYLSNYAKDERITILEEENRSSQIQIGKLIQLNKALRLDPSMGRSVSCPNIVLAFK